MAVIVPCYNDGALIGETLDSLRDQEPVELIVVDDASREERTIALLDELPAQGVRLERHEVNRGLSAARMTGLAHTAAPFVLPLDSDDLLAPGAVSRLADALEAASGAAVAFADYEEFGTRSRIVPVPARLDPYRVAFRNEYPVTSLFRRSALVEVGGWVDVAGMVGYEDWNLWMSLAERGMEGVHAGRGTVALRRRLHGTRMLGEAGRTHRLLYGNLRALHPALFGRLREHRRSTDLDLVRTWLYPLLYGARPPLGLGERLSGLRGRRRQAAG